MSGRLLVKRFVMNEKNGVIALAPACASLKPLDQDREQKRIERIIEWYREGQFYANLSIAEQTALSEEDLLRDTEEFIRFTSQQPNVIFTFANVERVKNEPFHTADTEFFKKLRRYIEREGGRIQESSTLYVPFANGCEKGLSGMRSLFVEVMMATSERDFLEIFGEPSDSIDVKFGAQK